jgi:hypothetical protein
MSTKLNNKDNNSSSSTEGSNDSSLNKNLFSKDHEKHKKIVEATIVSSLAVKLNVSMKDLEEVSKLPDGKGLNIKWLKEDFEKNKGSGIKNKIQELHQGINKENDSKTMESNEKNRENVKIEITKSKQIDKEPKKEVESHNKDSFTDRILKERENSNNQITRQ